MRVELARGVFEARRGGRRLRQRRALRQGEAGDHGVGIAVGKELEAEMTAQQQADHQHQNGHRGSGDDQAPRHGAPQRGHVDALDKPVEGAVDAAPDAQRQTANTPFGCLIAALGQSVRQVRRQDHRALQQGTEQRRHHGNGHHGNEFAHDALHDEQRHERRHRGRYRPDDRQGHFAGAVDGRLHRGLAATPVAVDVLAHHDGIVHQHAERHDEGEHGDHVEGAAVQDQNPQAAQQRHHQAHPHPERQPQVHEQPQAEEHQEQALQPVTAQQLQAASDNGRIVRPHAHGQPGRQLRRLLGDVPAHGVGNDQGVFLAGPEQGNQHAGGAVEPPDARRIDESVADPRHLVQRDHGAVRTRQQRQQGELQPGVALPGGAHHDVLRRRLDAASRQVEAAALHHLADFVERQAVAPQARLGDLDADFVVAGADQTHLRDEFGSQQVVAHPAGHLFQGPFRLLTVYGDVDDLAAFLELREARGFRVVGKGVDFLDLGLDVLQHPAVVHARLEPRQHHAGALARLRGDVLDALDALDRLFDLDDDTLLDLLGGGAGEEGLHLDGVEGYAREGLAPEVVGAHTADHDDHDHQQVGRHRIVHRARNKASHASALLSRVRQQGVGNGKARRI